MRNLFLIFALAIGLGGCATLATISPTFDVAREVAHGVAAEILVERLVQEGFSLTEAQTIVKAAHDAIHAGDL